MKKMNKVIAAMTVMAITFAMPATARSNKNMNSDKAKVVVVVNDKGAHFDKRGYHSYRHYRDGYRPVMRVCTFRVNRYDARYATAKAERIHGVIDAHWSPRTHEVVVRYDARVTSPRHIRHAMNAHRPVGRF